MLRKVKGNNSSQFKLLLALVCILACLSVSPSVIENKKVYNKPSSVGAANYYELAPNQYFISLGVKGYQQTTDYSCGPAAIMSLLHWYGLLDDSNMTHQKEMQLSGEMGTGDMESPCPGTTPEQMVRWLKSHNFKVIWGTNGTLGMLRENLKKGIPTIVSWIDWGGHWAVVTGYYAGSEAPEKGIDTIFFADPAVHWSSSNNPQGISSFSAWRFQDMWFNLQYFNSGKLLRNIYITAIPEKRRGCL